MLLGRFQRYVNRPTTLEKGVGWQYKLFWWVLPQSRFYEGVVIAEQVDGSSLLSVELHRAEKTNRFTRRHRRRKNIWVDLPVRRHKTVRCSLGLKHPDGIDCDWDEDCGHWGPASCYEVGEKIAILKMHFPAKDATKYVPVYMDYLSDEFPDSDSDNTADAHIEAAETP